MFDNNTGLLNLYLGYGDSLVHHATKQIKSLLCTCRSVTFSDNAKSMDDLSHAFTKEEKKEGDVSARSGNIINIH